MIKALTTASTGLEAQQANIERISNDMANVNTPSYKRGRSEFNDLMYETVKEAGGSLGAGSQSPVGIQIGRGVKVGAMHKIFEPGTAIATYNPNDIMIEGRGFFPVQMPNGEIAYTRLGAFKRDATGRWNLSNGAQLLPQITIPSNALNITVSPNGEVKALMPNQTEAIIGQIQLITFPNEEGLTAQGNGMYKPSLASGAPVQGIPGEDGLGTLQQNFLEGSNVNIANSMVDMITTQRAYEMNAKVMKTVDEMLGQTVNVKQ